MRLGAGAAKRLAVRFAHPATVAGSIRQAGSMRRALMGERCLNSWRERGWPEMKICAEAGSQAGYSRNGAKETRRFSACADGVRHSRPVRSLAAATLEPACDRSERTAHERIEVVAGLQK